MINVALDKNVTCFFWFVYPVEQFQRLVLLPTVTAADAQRRSNRLADLSAELVAVAQDVGRHIILEGDERLRAIIPDDSPLRSSHRLVLLLASSDSGCRGWLSFTTIPRTS